MEQLARARKAGRVARRTELAGRRRAARRRRRARHDRRAGAALPGRDRRSSSAAAWSTPAATTSSSRRCSASRSSSARTCRTSPRSRETFLANGAARPGAHRRASSRRRCVALIGRSGAARAARRRGAGAGRSQPRRHGKTLAVIAALLPPRTGRRVVPPVPAWSTERDVPLDARSVLSALLRGRRAAPARALRAAARPAPAPAPARSISVGNLASAAAARRRSSRALARLLLATRRAAGDPEPRLRRGAQPDDGVVVVSDGARDLAPISIAPATSR